MNVHGDLFADKDCCLFTDWDNIFAAYMFGALGEASAKDSAYSSLIQVIRSKTKHGFIANYAVAGSKSQDRSEEIIGSKVLFELYKQYKDKWVVELLFDDLLDWLDWAHEHRTLGVRHCQRRSTLCVLPLFSSLKGSVLWSCSHST